MKKKSDLELTPQSFSQASSLRDLMARAQAHAALEKELLAALPNALANGTRFVSCKEGELVISTDTSAKASQLRFRQHEIMGALRENPMFEFVWKLHVKVVPPRFKERPSHQMTPLSNENARLLKEEAGHTKDQQLREVLEKLASHVRR